MLDDQKQGNVEGPLSQLSSPFPPTDMGAVFGILAREGQILSIDDMENAVSREALRVA